MAVNDISKPAGSFPTHARALLVLGLPLIGSHVAQMAITLTDSIMVGWYDVTALAGLTIAGAVYFVVFIAGSGFAWAVMPMVAAAAGTDQDAHVRRVTRMGLWLSILFGLACQLLLIAPERLFLVLGQEAEVAVEAGAYTRLVLPGLIPAFVIMVLKSYLSALERTRVILAVTIGIAGLNVAVNYVLIFGNFGAPELGIRGAALASVIVNVVGAVALCLYAVWKTPEYSLFRNFQRPDWEAFGQVFRLGWPIGLTSLAEVGLFAAASLLVGWVGIYELAAHGIALQIASITFMVHVGLSQAVTVRTGQALGRRDRAALRRAAGMGMWLSSGFVVLTIAAFLILPEWLVGLFLSPGDPAREEIISIGVVLLALAALFQTADAAQVMALGMLRGVQDTRVPMVIAAISYWAVGIPSSVLLGFGLDLGAAGIWLGLVVGLLFAGVLLQWRFWSKASRIAG